MNDLPDYNLTKYLKKLWRNLTFVNIMYEDVIDENL